MFFFWVPFLRPQIPGIHPSRHQVLSDLGEGPGEGKSIWDLLAWSLRQMMVIDPMVIDLSW